MFIFVPKMFISQTIRRAYGKETYHDNKDGAVLLQGLPEGCPRDGLPHALPQGRAHDGTLSSRQGALRAIIAESVR